MTKQDTNLVTDPRVAELQAFTGLSDVEVMEHLQADALDNDTTVEQELTEDSAIVSLINGLDDEAGDDSDDDDDSDDGEEDL